MRKKVNMKKKPEKLNHANDKYSVVKFIDTSYRLFECIPDLWFIDEDKAACFWPPKSKSVMLRAMNQDGPDDDGEVYECEVVSEGHATYSIGCSIVREKVSQRYNTSSADEHLQAAEFRRKHPGLIDTGENSFENVFAASDDAKKNRKVNCEANEQKKQGKSNETTNSGQVLLNKKCGDGNNKENDLPVGSLVDEFSAKTHTSSKASTQSSSIIASQSQTSNASHTYPSPSTNLQSRSHHSKSLSSHSQSSKHSRSHSKCQNSPTKKSKRYRSISGSASDAETGNKHSQSHSQSKSQSSQSQSNKRNRSSSGSGNNSKFGNKGSQTPRNNSKSHSDSKYQGSQSQLRKRYNSSSGSGSNSEYGKRSYAGSSIRSHPSKIHYSSIRKSSSRSRSNIRSRSISRDQSRFGSKTSSRSSYCSRSSISNHSTSKSRYRSKTRPRNKSGTRSRSISRSSYSRSSIRSSNRSRSNSGFSSFRSRKSRSHSERSTRPGTVPRNSPLSNSDSRGRMNKIHQPKQSTSRSNFIQNVESAPRRGIENQQVTQSTAKMQALIDDVNKLANAVNKNNRRFIENERRSTRMEVTINKTFVMLNDLTNAINTRMSIVGNSLSREVELPRGFHMPRVPIKTLKELTIIKRDLRDKTFFNFLKNHEKEFCTLSSATDTATMTAYLNRFIDVPVRASMVLKDLKGQSGLTLYHDYHRVYLFLIEVMKAGYLIKNKVLTNKDVHATLRVVWGRSKQMLNEMNKQKGRTKKNRPRASRRR